MDPSANNCGCTLSCKACVWKKVEVMVRSKPTNINKCSQYLPSTCLFSRAWHTLHWHVVWPFEHLLLWLFTATTHEAIWAPGHIPHPRAGQRGRTPCRHSGSLLVRRIAGCRVQTDLPKWNLFRRKNTSVPLQVSNEGFWGSETRRTGSRMCRNPYINLPDNMPMSMPVCLGCLRTKI